MMNQEKLKGHLLILAANILFAINTVSYTQLTLPTKLEV